MVRIKWQHLLTVIKQNWFPLVLVVMVFTAAIILIAQGEMTSLYMGTKAKEEEMIEERAAASASEDDPVMQGPPEDDPPSRP
jgi:hypothetical protein